MYDTVWIKSAKDLRIEYFSDQMHMVEAIRSNHCNDKCQHQGEVNITDVETTTLRRSTDMKCGPPLDELRESSFGKVLLRFAIEPTKQSLFPSPPTTSSPPIIDLFSPISGILGVVTFISSFIGISFQPPTCSALSHPPPGDSLVHHG